MIQENINFRTFYLNEFYNAVDQNAKLRLSEKKYAAINSLLLNLKSEEDSSSNIELLAREHGTSELSIFLYDIIDRINEYPPTAVHDSMPEMVDDFVNTLEVMLEEESTISSLEKVNSAYKNISEVDSRADKNIEIEKESKLELLNFAEFINLEFIDVFNTELLKKDEAKDSTTINEFLIILLENLQNPILFNAPEGLVKIVEDCDQIFVQQNSDISMINVYRNIKNLMPGIVNKILNFENDHPEIIVDSLKAKTLVISEPISDTVKQEPHEEAPKQEEPSSIENLLSTYFQSEINEYLEMFNDGFDAIKNDPKNITELENLENKFHAFKEISMIHGYEILESSCVNVMQLLSKVRTKKFEFSDEFFVASEDLLNEIKNSQKLKGKTRSSKEGDKVEAIITRMSEATIESEKRALPKIEKSKDTQDIKEVEKKKEELISLKDQEAAFAILKELWFDIQPALSKDLLEKRNIKNSITIFKKISSCASLIEQPDIAKFVVDIISRLDSLKSLNQNEINNGCAILFIIQENILSGLNPSLDKENYELELNKFDDIFKKSISINNVDSLIEILIELDRQNLDSFTENFTKIFDSNDKDELRKQKTHFSKSAKNYELIGLNNVIKFPVLYSDLLEENFITRFNKDIINELYQSYKLFIDNVAKNKKLTNIEDLVSTLNEVISEIAPVQKDDESLIDSDADIEIPEEDLDQIFKDEAKNYVWKIEDSLALLEADPTHNKPFEVIEKNAHSLKSSARLMGHDDIHTICNSIEIIAELFLQNKISPESETLESIKSSVNAIISFIDGDEKNIASVGSELIQLQEKLNTEMKDTTTPGTQKTDESSQNDEVPLFIDTDQDDDLLDIFKEESMSFINTIDKAINNLKNGVENTEEIHQFEYASHSLKSAAKMLGFREIGQISDGLEQIAESLYKSEITPELDLLSSLEKSIGAVRSLSEGNKIPSDEISDIINLLDINQIKEDQKTIKKTDSSESSSEIKEDIDPMVDLFLKEAWEMLEKINRDLVQFESKHDISILENLNRNVHTLKGSAQMMQFEKIGHLAHIVEDYLETQIENKDTIPDDYLQPIFNAFDEIQNIMESIKNGHGEISTNYNNILNKLGIIQSGAKPEELPIEKESQIVEQQIIQESPIPEKTSKVVEEVEKSSTKGEDSQQIKITTERLDNLINMAAELVINKTQLSNYVDSLKKLGLDLDKDRKVLKNAEYSLDDIILKRKYEHELNTVTEDNLGQGQKMNDLALISNDFKKTINTIDLVSSKFNNLTHGFEQNIGRLAHLIKMLHDDVLQVRMVPVENLFNRFPRAVRDLARKQKKKVNLQIEGSDTEMDRAMIESLTDPLMHIVRNSIDHGIELPMHRKKAGKDNAGKMILKAKQDKNQIIVEVEDDGRGIDINAVKNTIIKKKILSKEETNKLSTGEILDYIFYPGFSTKKSTSKISGRGIGLDVVASQVQKLKGDIRVNSTTGQSTVFSIRVPLTLIISQAMLFKLTDQILAVPLISVDKSIQFNKSAIQDDNGKMFINYKGDQIPIINLNQLLKFSDDDLKQELKAILIQESDVKCALIVDEVLHREEIVIKSLGAHLQNLEFISGGTILGDGTVALILDTSSVIRKIEKEYLQKEKATLVEKPEVAEKTKDQEPEVAIKRKQIKNRKPVALIVDDSISVRRFVASVLEKNNYDTVLASDGINALEDLKDKSFDIVITDLEMPKMHGYELIEKIRKQKKLSDLPIVILTGRAGKKHKDMGIKLGANAFIVKPFKDNDLLSTLKKFIDN